MQAYQYSPQVTKLVLTVITVYIICWLPHWVTQVTSPSSFFSQLLHILLLTTKIFLQTLTIFLHQIALISQPPGSRQSNTLVIVILLADCLQYSNSAMNPVLYAFLSENFKKSFRKVS